MPDLGDVERLGVKESGLAVAITIRENGTPRASLVNAGVLSNPVTGERVVAFVSRGHALKLRDLRRVAQATLVFRSGWEWVAVEGPSMVIGPDDPLEGFDEEAVLRLIRSVYAAAVGGSPEEWSHLDDTMATERHTAVLVEPLRIYPTEAT